MTPVVDGLAEIIATIDTSARSAIIYVGRNFPHGDAISLTVCPIACSLAPNGDHWHRPPCRSNTPTGLRRTVHLVTSKLLTQHRLSVSVHTVNFKHVLRQIDFDRRKSPRWTLPPFEWLMTTQAHPYRYRSGRPSHCLRFSTLTATLKRFSRQPSEWAHSCSPLELSGK